MSCVAELYACLLVREFPAQALLRLRPELREHACVVMEGNSPTQQVCSINCEAMSFGIERGMTQVEVNTFPGVTALPRSWKEEDATKAALLECVGCFSPRVEDCSKDCAFLCVVDISGTRTLFGSPETLAQNLLTSVRALGLTASAAVSSNFHTSEALAKGLAPFGQIQVVATGEEATALASLPLAVLDLDETQAETFALWGIRDLGMLAELPENALIARMGQAGKRLRQLARGELPHLFQPVEPAFTLEERMDLDTPVEVLDALLFVLNLMLEQLILRASARVLALASVTVTLTLEGGITHSRTIRPALPTNDRKLWIKLLHLELEAHPPNAAIRVVATHAEPGSTSKVQLGLFAPQLPEPSRLDVTLARIRSIVGENNVGRAVLKDTHEPDAFRIEPFTIAAAQPSEAPATTPRPAIRQLRPPEATFVTTQSGRPAAFVFRARRYAVERAYGPWQSSGEWWNPTLWGCEQWDVIAHTSNGTTLCCCLVRDLLRDQWQLTGLYD
jgi:protein ImuB